MPPRVDPAKVRPRMTPPHARRLALLALLYLVQGMPLGVQSQVLPQLLRDQGVTLAAIGFLQYLAFPWFLKPLWALWVDAKWSARFGRRRTWLLPALAGLAATCAVAAHVQARHGLVPLLALVALMQLFASVQDVAADALAVDTFSRGELRSINAAQVGGYKVGMAVSGGLLMSVSDRLGWGVVFAGMTALTLVALLVVALWRERPSEGADAAPRTDAPRASPERAPVQRSAGEVLRTLGRAVRVPGALWLLLFVATYDLGDQMGDTLFKLFLRDAGVSRADIGLWVGTAGLAASTLGSISIAFVAPRAPLLPLLLGASVVRILPLVGRWALAAAGGAPAGWQVASLTLVEHFVSGVVTALVFAFMMSRTDRRVGASHYSLLATVELVGKNPAAPLAGLLAHQLGYAPVFLVAALLALVPLALLLRVARTPVPEAAPA